MTYLIILAVTVAAIFIGAVGFALCERFMPWDDES